MCALLSFCVHTFLLIFWVFSGSQRSKKVYHFLALSFRKYLDISKHHGLKIPYHFSTSTFDKNLAFPSLFSPVNLGYILLKPLIKMLANVSISHTQRCVFSLQRCNSFRPFPDSERSDKNSERSVFSEP